MIMTVLLAMYCSGRVPEECERLFSTSSNTSRASSALRPIFTVVGYHFKYSAPQEKFLKSISFVL